MQKKAQKKYQIKLSRNELDKLNPDLKTRIGGEVIDFSVYKEFLNKVGNPVIRAANIHYERSLTYEEAARQIAKMTGMKVSGAAPSIKWIFMVGIGIIILYIIFKGGFF